MTSTDRPAAAGKGGHRRATAVARALSLAVTTLLALIGAVLYAAPAQAEQVDPGASGVITIPAVPAGTFAPNTLAEITATVIAGVLILGAAVAVLVYTARHRDSLD